MKIRTPFGTRDDVSSAELVEELEALQRLEVEEGAFVVVEREDGEFLQMRALPIERGGAEGVRRAGLPAAVRELFVGFAEGRKGWDGGWTWETEASGGASDAPASRPAPWILVVIAVGMLGLLAWVVSLLRGAASQ